MSSPFHFFAFLQMIYGLYFPAPFLFFTVRSHEKLGFRFRVIAFSLRVFTV